eukprot:gnl/MRDRNA2_/MRDRNA2_73792_c0_seq2.p1 gnl/MRDRNA2_/MRDRNA2_73792_c0~~gnl/MRDRNA2_/MRDRNA2_73792_c0_seq2.p1  ORF type:complete len:125 (+),score=0.44 gnl/MRDRNA2_/MRDRNA2_73792_c0_seq2:2-376(+)
MLAISHNSFNVLVQKMRVRKLPTHVVNAKYGDKTIYFDLDDMANTIGNWDLYGQDDRTRYPSLQSDFFNRAGQALSRRPAMLAFCAMFGTATILGWGLKGSKDAKLPITIGPQKTPQVGPRGRI